MIIGDSIQNAIDWTQDELRTTRPLAESTLFTMLETALVTETEQGYMLHEEDEEERTRTMRKIHTKATAPQNKNHMARRHFKKHSTRMQHMKHLDNSTAAEDMIAKEKKHEHEGADEVR
jgi:hypothetical protein